MALAVRLDCNHRYHHNNGEERGRLKCIIKLQREELELVSVQRLRRGLFDYQLCCSLTGGPPLVWLWSPLVQIPFGLVVFVISKFVLVEFSLCTTQLVWILHSIWFFPGPKNCPEWSKKATQHIKKDLLMNKWVHHSSCEMSQKSHHLKSTGLMETSVNICDAIFHEIFL